MHERFRDSSHLHLCSLHTFKVPEAAQNGVYGKSASRACNAPYNKRPGYHARVHLPDEVHPRHYEPGSQCVEARLHFPATLLSELLLLLLQNMCMISLCLVEW